MWFALWLVLSAFVMGIFAWSMLILQQQKKAWFFFAKKMELEYRAGKYTDSPVVTGIVNHCRVTFFTDSLRTKDVRGRRFVTTIEIEMGPGMPTAGVLATPDYAEFLAPLNLPLSYQPPGTWDKTYIVRTRDTDLMARYLTPERIAILAGLFAMKNSACLFFFDPRDCILRIETSDPLRDADRMEKISRRLFTAVEGLKLTSVEKQQFAALVPATPPPPPPPVPAPAPEVAEPAPAKTPGTDEPPK